MKGKRNMKVIILIAVLVLAVGIGVMIKKDTTSPIVQKQLTSKEFDQIEVDVANANIKIRKSDRYRVTYNGREKLIPSTKIENQILKVESNTSSVNINVNIFDLFKKNAVVPAITIEVPKKELDKVTIDSSNGNVTVKDLALKRGQIDTSNGSVVVRNSVAQGYDLDTSNGRITVNGQDEGDTYSQNDVGDNVLEIDTSNGNITVN
ncbi:DUF4097 family beta strand repeat-containing protein [Lactobacillus crispatus]|uniref:DUF4097 domain-containing protein n=1 Tax=Lactobacillus crispatus TaxID=47770 RepID=A0A2N5L0W2_9LACO|nr:DUF4097 family beta strand repeat-containing protein [Lactobacillus crispatus]KAA8790283.1 DUF4097 domain-containing protein [Lactobacillus crispatus]KAA8790452.1 DUF4097 domain-containing protein [Lactobacillus crispatus]MDK7319708.1 DUF4097 family beta strand repeat-containing protein [Lactobacillus crispatus]MDK8272164.1 DUF4097 family beta strand repeat-containing protein [Lactobacillus crispatus]MDK8568233.1 DUF4097 family beta strand repeat-containing protein [Lactobacillus crispatus]